MGAEQKIKREILLPKFYRSSEMKFSGIHTERINVDEGLVENKEVLRQFKQRVDMFQPVSNVGDISAQTIKHELESSDENYYAGLQEERKYVNPAMDVVAVFGAKELSKGLRAELNQITITSGQIYNLIRDGSISMPDLSDKKLL